MTHHAALTPANIQKFFEDVQCDAERIIAWCNFCSKNQTQDGGGFTVFCSNNHSEE